jgi:hypothetical protein
MKIFKILLTASLVTVNFLNSSVENSQAQSQHQSTFFIYQGIGKGDNGRNNAKYILFLKILKNDVIEGFIDIDPLFGSSTNNCAAGNISGKLDSLTRKMNLSFTSFDNDPGCGWDHGYRVELKGEATGDLQQLILVLQSYTPSGKAYFRENISLSLKRRF